MVSQLAGLPGCSGCENAGRSTKKESGSSHPRRRLRPGEDGCEADAGTQDKAGLG